jgi:hypothetical protein
MFDSNGRLSLASNRRRNIAVLILVGSRLIGSSVVCRTSAQLILHSGEFNEGLAETCEVLDSSPLLLDFGNTFVAQQIRVFS